MGRSHAVGITASAGAGGVNRGHDVLVVQKLINEHLPSGVKRLAVDGSAGPLTIAAISKCQHQFLGLPHPDSRIDPHGPTLHALNALEPAPHPMARVRPPQPAAATGPKPATPAGATTPSSPAGAPRPTPVVAHGFGIEVITAAQTAQAATKIPAAITLAQWAIEGGYGKHMPTGSNNPFGIKAAGGQPYVEARTREVIHGKTVYIDAHFRKFASLAEAFEKHGELLATGRPYAHARTLIGDPDKFADALTGVYATDPNYGTLLKSVIKSANLYQYD